MFRILVLCLATSRALGVIGCEPQQSRSTRATARQLNLGLPFVANLGPPGSTPQILKTLTGAESKSSLGGLMEGLMPNLPVAGLGTLTKTTAAPDPIQQLSKNLAILGSSLGMSGSIMEAPMKIMNNLLSGTLNLSLVSTNTIDNAATRIAKATEATGKAMIASSQMIRPTKQPKSEDDSMYYEFAAPEEPYFYRKSKYFSKECNFRVACEVGHFFKPLTYQFYKGAESNRLVQDLQNRYTRAITYGTLHDNCQRYYCVLVQLIGGPQAFAGGIAEMVNRAMNPDLYEGHAEH